MDAHSRTGPAAARSPAGGYRIELNGGPAGADALRALATTNYGHFTSMQVRDGRVRGLDLHLQRLDLATRELFGHALDAERTRAWMRHAIGSGGAALSLRVQVQSLAFDRERPDRASAPDVLVATAPAREAPAAPLRLRSVRYAREAPHLKHLGTFGLFHQRRLAQAAGFDDALFVDATGAVAEAAVWNVGFFDGERVVWPDAPALRGVSMRLLQDGLARIGAASATRRVPLAEAGGFRSAFLTNSACIAVPVAAIDGVAFAPDPALRALLDAAMATQPPQRI